MIDHISCCTHQSGKDNVIDPRHLKKYFDDYFIFGISRKICVNQYYNFASVQL